MFCFGIIYLCLSHGCWCLLICLLYGCDYLVSCHFSHYGCGSICWNPWAINCSKIFLNCKMLLYCWSIGAIAAYAIYIIKKLYGDLWNSYSFFGLESNSPNGRLNIAGQTVSKCENQLVVVEFWGKVNTKPSAKSTMMFHSFKRLALISIMIEIFYFHCGQLLAGGNYGL